MRALPDRLPGRRGGPLGTRLAGLRPLPLAARLFRACRHLGDILDAPEEAAKLDLIRSETSFNLWQSILRGAG